MMKPLRSCSGNGGGMAICSFVLFLNIEGDEILLFSFCFFLIYIYLCQFKLKKT